LWTGLEDFVEKSGDGGVLGGQLTVKVVIAGVHQMLLIVEGGVDDAELLREALVGGCDGVLQPLLVG